MQFTLKAALSIIAAIALILTIATINWKVLYINGAYLVEGRTIFPSGSGPHGECTPEDLLEQDAHYFENVEVRTAVRRHGNYVIERRFKGVPSSEEFLWKVWTPEAYKQYLEVKKHQ